MVHWNIETAAMLIYQTDPLEVELFSYVNTSLFFQLICTAAATWVKTNYWVISKSILLFAAPLRMCHNKIQNFFIQSKKLHNRYSRYKMW